MERLCHLCLFSFLFLFCFFLFFSFFLFGAGDGTQGLLYLGKSFANEEVCINAYYNNDTMTELPPDTCLECTAIAKKFMAVIMRKASFRLKSLKMQTLNFSQLDNQARSFCDQPNI